MTTSGVPEFAPSADPFARDSARQSLGEPQLLLREATTAALATLDVDGAYPYASLVAIATLADGTPVLLLSELARHTRNLAANPKGSLLVASSPEGDDPLTAPRLTVAGRFRRTTRADATARYLARHPTSAGYVAFADFAFYELEISFAHLVAGFGRIRTFKREEMQAAQSMTLDFDDEAEIIRHMNDDHRDAIAMLAQACGHDGTGARITGVDQLGCDLIAGTKGIRISFPTPLVDAADARRAFKLLVELARAKV